MVRVVGYVHVHFHPAGRDGRDGGKFGTRSCAIASLEAVRGVGAVMSYCESGEE